jgi:DNA mismatch repair protein MutS
MYIESGAIRAMIIDDYLDYMKTYKAKYGDKCIVLMQVGSFYEMYSVVDDTSEDIYSIADICNIQISRKNKSIKEVSISNPLMAGFPLYTLQKFTGILLNNNYTIVLIEQVTEPPNPQRKITDILSPGMNLNITSKRTNYMMVIYYEFVGNLPIAGVAGIDLSTGNCFAHEAGANKSDPEFANDEVFRMMATYNPCEVVILSDKNYDNDLKTYLLNNLNLTSGNLLVHYKWDTFDYIKSMQKLSFQTAILERAFAQKKRESMLNIIESLNLEKYSSGRTALCCLLQFAYEHNVDIIQQLNVPEIINDNMHLTIEYNSAVQLNVLGLYPHDKPLIDILNRCQTAFGSRVFRERLLKPVVDKDVLNKRYDAIEFLLQDCKFKFVNKHLVRILDLERIKRKMMIEKYNPQDWCGFNTSLENAVEILEKYLVISDADLLEYKEMIDFYSNIIDLNEASKYNIGDIKGNIFLKGVYTEIDAYTEEFQNAYDRIVRTCNDINKLDVDCKIEYSDKDGHYLLITKKRYETAKSKNAEYFKNFTVKNAGTATNTNLKICNQEILVASGIMDDKQNMISRLVTEYYHKFIKDFLSKYASTLDKLIRAIVDIDINCCNARNAFEYRYYRPFIAEGTDSKCSFIDVENLRHPIIERIDDSIPYVGNDIRLSNDCSDGMLLYGINAAGKSSLMKSVGLCIIMAQAGMYVPASKMVYHPYRHIFTRISGMDNIYKGMSSFTVEMTELRNILQRCDKYSLVLGDEICSGTEATSALAIVAAGLDTLVKKKASFIFATHLHQLTRLDIVKMYLQSSISVKHIHITIDENNRIVYERKLRDGQGSSTYGIEVCKSLDMPIDFMKIAEGVRKQMEGYDTVIVNPEHSRYHKDIYMNKCNICGGVAEDTHHIQYQCESDADGNFRDFHKNIKHNLVPLCKKCHKKEHSGEIDIKGYKKTSAGIVIDVSVNPVIVDKNENIVDDAKLTQEDCELVKQYVKRGKCNWYMRLSRTNTFKKCTDERKMIEKINKVLKRVVAYGLEEQRLYNLLYDPNM